MAFPPPLTIGISTDLETGFPPRFQGAWSSFEIVSESCDETGGRGPYEHPVIDSAGATPPWPPLRKGGRIIPSLCPDCELARQRGLARKTRAEPVAIQGVSSLISMSLNLTSIGSFQTWIWSAMIPSLSK